MQNVSCNSYAGSFYARKFPPLRQQKQEKIITLKTDSHKDMYNISFGKRIS